MKCWTPANPGTSSIPTCSSWTKWGLGEGSWKEGEGGKDGDEKKGGKSLASGEEREGKIEHEEGRLGKVRGEVRGNQGGDRSILDVR